MAIPTFDLMLRPILALAAKREITRRSATAEMAREFGLDQQEQDLRTPSGGQTYVRNRTGWAMSFLTKGGLIAKVAPRTYRATARGEEFLTQHSERIRVKDLKVIPGWEEAWGSGDSGGAATPIAGDDAAATPIDALDSALASLSADLRSRLLEAILRQSPAFFEQLVLDVLIAMGYGGSREDAAQHLGQSGDEGIDGRINQDPLGLDQIMVQAKRYASDRPVDRKTIQAFIGSLAGQGVSKGIFITTSSFAESAREFVLRGSSTKIVLIDGALLLDLMMRHHIGVRVERHVELRDLDQNYFEENE